MGAPPYRRACYDRNSGAVGSNVHSRGTKNRVIVVERPTGLRQGGLGRPPSDGCQKRRGQRGVRSIGPCRLGAVGDRDQGALPGRGIPGRQQPLDLARDVAQDIASDCGCPLRTRHRLALTRSKGQPVDLGASCANRARGPIGPNSSLLASDAIVIAVERAVVGVCQVVLRRVPVEVRYPLT